MSIVTTMLYIVIIAGILLLIYALIYNHFQDHNVRISAVEDNIDNILRIKYDFLLKLVKLLKKSAETSAVNELNELKEKKKANFELDRDLSRITNVLYGIIESDKKLQNNDNIKKAHLELSDNDEKLMAYRNYYNDQIIKYNKLVKMFPTNIVGKLSRFKEKAFYASEYLGNEANNDLKL